jgi:hypothetical protein
MRRFWWHVYIGADARAPGIVVGGPLFDVVSHVKIRQVSISPRHGWLKSRILTDTKILRETLALARLFGL